jgi:hypothetical protein
MSYSTDSTSNFVSEAKLLRISQPGLPQTLNHADHINSTAHAPLKIRLKSPAQEDTGRLSPLQYPHVNRGLDQMSYSTADSPGAKYILPSPLEAGHSSHSRWNSKAPRFEPTERSRSPGPIYRPLDHKGVASQSALGVLKIKYSSRRDHNSIFSVSPSLGTAQEKEGSYLILSTRARSPTMRMMSPVTRHVHSPGAGGRTPGGLQDPYKVSYYRPER